MSRAYNFSAGPATIPEEVLKQAQAELLDWQQSGMSVMEISHRGELFAPIVEQSEIDLRKLLNIPANYRILFLQGGGRSQFAMVPLNLLNQKKSANYLDTGVWSKIAIQEAQKYCQVNIAASSAQANYTTIPDPSTWHIDSDSAYFHYVDNETVNGVALYETPPINNMPLICDMSSSILSRPIDVSRFGLIYAGAQKNIGPAGLTIVIIREDLLGHALSITPTMFNYEVHAKNRSLYNTPPTFSWYMAGLVFQWLLKKGGVEAIHKLNLKKAQKLYDYIDQSDFYICHIDKKYRSITNVVFYLADELLITNFLKEAAKAKLMGLKGHALVGGLRASLYNAMSEEGVDQLIKFMMDFEKHYG